MNSESLDRGKEISMKVRQFIRIAAAVLGALMIICGVSFLYERLTENPEMGGDYPPDMLWILFGIFCLAVALRGRLLGRGPRQLIRRKKK